MQNGVKNGANYFQEAGDFDTEVKPFGQKTEIEKVVGDFLGRNEYTDSGTGRASANNDIINPITKTDTHVSEAQNTNVDSRMDVVEDAVNSSGNSKTEDTIIDDIIKEAKGLDKNSQGAKEITDTGTGRKASSPAKVDLKQIHNSDELLDALYDSNSMKNNEARDKKIVQKYLDAEKAGKRTEDFMFQQGHTNYNVGDVIVDNTVHTDSWGSVISGDPHYYTSAELKAMGRGQADYRITFKNSTEITADEGIAFVNTFVEEANKRGLNLTAKNLWESDALILYLEQSELADTVELLEDLKSNPKYGKLVNDATKHFGEVQPFSATVGEDSYYGIAMGQQEPSAYWSKYNNGGRASDIYGNLSTFYRYSCSVSNRKITNSKP